MIILCSASPRPLNNLNISSQGLITGCIMPQRLPPRGGGSPHLGQELNSVHGCLGGVVPPPHQRPSDDNLVRAMGGWSGDTVLQ